MERPKIQTSLQRKKTWKSQTTYISTALRPRNLGNSTGDGECGILLRSLHQCCHGWQQIASFCSTSELLTCNSATSFKSRTQLQNPRREGKETTTASASSENFQNSFNSKLSQTSESGEQYTNCRPCFANPKIRREHTFPKIRILFFLLRYV